MGIEARANWDEMSIDDSLENEFDRLALLSPELFDLSSEPKLSSHEDALDMESIRERPSQRLKIRDRRRRLALDHFIPPTSRESVFVPPSICGFFHGYEESAQNMFSDLHTESTENEPFNLDYERTSFRPFNHQQETTSKRFLTNSSNGSFMSVRSRPEHSNPGSIFMNSFSSGKSIYYSANRNFSNFSFGRQTAASPFPLPTSETLAGADNDDSDLFRRMDSVLSRTPTGIFARLDLDYRTSLRERNLILPLDQEVNWSGKGQHVTYSIGEQAPLKVLSHLGSSPSASVDKVLCRRIVLARKTMRCTKKWKIEDALVEVEHLHRLRHVHIVQLVGSYLQGREFAILMYPAADCDLGVFLQHSADLLEEEASRPSDLRLLGSVLDRFRFLASCLQCLLSALAFVHARTTKHMDIKPANILVREFRDRFSWRVYLADFGLSRTFTAEDHSQTDGPTGRTPKYCAPEVYDFDYRGRSADVFSLGCVFLEILTVYRGYDLQDFADHRRGDNSDESFRSNLPQVANWVADKIRSPVISSRNVPSIVADIVEEMVQSDPERRPKADEAFSSLQANVERGSPFAPNPVQCCNLKPGQYVAYTGEEASALDYP